MSLHITCDQCGISGEEDRGVLYALGFATVDKPALSVRLYEYPALLHWRCIPDYIRRRDTEEEPPF